MTYSGGDSSVSSLECAARRALSLAAGSGAGVWSCLQKSPRDQRREGDVRRRNKWRVKFAGRERRVKFREPTAIGRAFYDVPRQRPKGFLGQPRGKEFWRAGLGPLYNVRPEALFSEFPVTPAPWTNRYSSVCFLKKYSELIYSHVKNNNRLRNASNNSQTFVTFTVCQKVHFTCIIITFLRTA
ncbi:uncharacterized protein LOC108312930 [Cebus imitator]|uniref:uncharacterized protein LOC108312930 n=1 Tax=Cebus imitator TaxID=2715852 RepID=UPI001897F5F7|nr:uncharacterized protein LOC108312930 [Cebus imitator]